MSLGGRRPGVTLIELLVAIAIIGVMAGMAIQGFANVRRAADGDRFATIERELQSARSTALRSRRPVVVQIADSAGALSAIALPDGSMIGDATLRRDRLTGRRFDSVAASRY